MPRINGLTDKQRLFAYEYLVDFSGKQAAIRAGYSPKNAKWEAVQLMKKPEVLAIIERGKADRMQHLEITREHVLEELAAIAFANTLDYFRITPEGDPMVDLSGLREDDTLTEAQRRAVRAKAAALAELQVDDYTEGRGENQRDVRRVKFKMNDKQKALELLGKHLGIFVERHDITSGGAAIPITGIEIVPPVDDGSSDGDGS